RGRLEGLRRFGQVGGRLLNAGTGGREAARRRRESIGGSGAYQEIGGRTGRSGVAGRPTGWRRLVEHPSQRAFVAVGLDLQRIDAVRALPLLAGPIAAHVVARSTE